MGGGWGGKNRVGKLRGNAEYFICERPHIDSKLGNLLYDDYAGTIVMH